MWTRRNFIKGSLITSGSLLVPATRWLRASDLPPSPPTRPFVAPLPIPPVVRPVIPFATRFPTDSSTVFYEVHEREALHSFHPDLPPSPVWAYQALNTPVTTTPGPTFHERIGQPVVARFVNDLPTAPEAFGVPNTSVHRHGGFQESLSDGFPTAFFRPGEFFDYCWPAAVAGDDEAEAESTLWYHDHLVDFTAQNVYKGLAGMYLVFDALDSGDENDTNPSALRLPSGDFDIPLVVQDRLFAPNGTLFYDPFSHNGFLGDKFVVNGAIQPFLRVAPRKYRFRFLNGSNARFYQFFLDTGQPFTVIGTDDHLLPRALSLKSFLTAPAQRREVVIDFSRYSPGDEILLQNRLLQADGRGPTKLVAPGTPIMRFIVDPQVNGGARDPSRVPNMLRPLPPIDPARVTVRRSFFFERRGGAWVINRQFFDADRIVAQPRLGVPEIWVLKNGGGGWWHPIHIHLESFRTLTRNGRPPSALESGRQDTLTLAPNDEVQILIQFRRFAGRYVFHCHNLEHEDMAMMARFDTV